MNPVLHELHKSCSLLIRTSTGVPLGTGVLVTPERVLTCEHVVKQHGALVAGGIGVTGSRRDKERDLALLELETHATMPPAYLDGECGSGDVLHAYGYPDGKPRPERYSAGQIFPYQQTYLLKLYEEHPLSGMSGSPVLNERTGCVCAIVRKALDHIGGFQGAAIPLSEVFAAWPELRDQNAEAHAGRDDWSRHLPKWKRLDWNALRSQTLPEIDYYRSELVLRMRSFLPPGAAALDIPTSLAAEWNRFADEKTWLELLVEYTTAILGRAAELRVLYPPAEEVLNAAVQVERLLKKDLRYPVLRRQLQQLFENGKLERSTADLVRRTTLDRTDGGRDRNEETAERVALALQRAVLDLRAQLSEPFSKCFLVQGSFGMGKSHFVARTLQMWRDSPPDQDIDWLFFPIGLPQPGASVMEVLLAAINQFTREDWQSLQEFQGFVAARQEYGKIIFGIEDLERWLDAGTARLDELLRAIEELTSLDRYHWCITLNQPAYARIARRTSQFWRTYCAGGPNLYRQEQGPFVSRREPERPVRAGGWYQLDEIAAAQETGKEIIERVRGELMEPAPAGSAGAAGAGNPNRDRLLNTPLVAWLLIGAAPGAAVVADLRFIGFVRLFDQCLIARATEDAEAQTGFNENVIAQTIHYAARAVAAGKPIEGTLVQARKTLLALMQDEVEFGNRPLSEPVLQALERVRLLVSSERAVPSQTTTVPHVEVGTDIVWEYHIARQILRMIPADGSVEIAGFTKDRLHGLSVPGLSSGAAQFILLLVDSEEEPPLPADQREALWNAAMRDPVFPLHSTLYAASWSPPPRQKQVAEFLVKTAPLQTKTASALLAMAHFVRVCAPSVLKAPARVMILHRHFQALAEEGLGDYSAFILSKVLEQVSGVDELLQCMQWLEGCEMLANADELAAQCVDAMVEYSKDDTPTFYRFLLRYLRFPPKLSEAYERAQRDRADSGLGSSVDRYLFRHWVLDEASGYLAESEEDLYWYLFNRGWYTDRSVATQTLRIEMEKFANFAISNESKSSPKKKNSLRVLINELVEKESLVHRRNAFFLIRHTKTILFPQAPVVVDEDYHPALQILYNDRRLERLHERFRAFFEANLEGHRQPKPRPKPGAKKRKRAR